MNDAVIIREVGPREGFQTLPGIVPTAEKIALIDMLSLTGVREMEIASFVRADRLPQMADGEQVVAGYRRQPGVQYLGLYLNQKGFERAEATARLDNRGWLYTAVSDQFLRSNNNTSRAQILSEVRSWLELFGRHGKSLHGVMISTAFGYHGEGRFDASLIVETLEPLMRAVKEAGQSVTEISLADTVGLGVPDQVRRAVSAAREAFPQSTLSLHLHDTFGAGLANAYAGYLEGVRIFESSVGGMGGCPFAAGASGNISTEDLAVMFEGMGVATGLDLERYRAAAQLAERITGARLPGKMMRNQ